MLFSIIFGFVANLKPNTEYYFDTKNRLSIQTSIHTYIFPYIEIPENLYVCINVGMSQKRKTKYSLVVLQD